MAHTNLWSSENHALGYLAIADTIPHRTEAEKVLLELVPKTARNILDLGAGHERLLSLLKIDRPEVESVAVDFSATMLEAAKKRFAGDAKTSIIAHNVDDPLLNIVEGRFDAVVSSKAIHHLTHPRKRSIYAEIFDLLNDGGVFCNLENVSSPTPAIHAYFRKAIGIEDKPLYPSNKLLDVET
jgi:ubiquinone/menaquinone biosynthesis C-methylase UbiE